MFVFLFVSLFFFFLVLLYCSCYKALNKGEAVFWPSSRLLHYHFVYCCKYALFYYFLILMYIFGMEINDDINVIHPNTDRDNLSSAERNILKTLCKSKELTLKPVDKESGVV